MQTSICFGWAKQAQQYNFIAGTSRKKNHPEESDISLLTATHIVDGAIGQIVETTNNQQQI